MSHHQPHHRSPPLAAPARAVVAKPALKVLVVDVGGTHVKYASTDHPVLSEFASGPGLTAADMVRQVLKLTRGWRYDAVTIGYPGVVAGGLPVRDPQNLGRGWVGFDFAAAFGRPVRIINDAAMQALGDYAGGKMLFLGLGTGLGSALIVDGVVVPMELAHLQCRKGRDYEYYVGDRGRRRLGEKKWRAKVLQAMDGFRNALQPDEVLLGGGNARRLKRLPADTRLGDNFAAFRGGLRLWDDPARSPKVHALPGGAGHKSGKGTRRSKTTAPTPR
jgi:polyphosphate glucokinase